MPLRTGFALFWIVSLPALLLASIHLVPEHVTGSQASLMQREHQTWSLAVHDSEFAALTHPAVRAQCGAEQPPQALATPDPLLDEADTNSKVSVSFIIGT